MIVGENVGRYAQYIEIVVTVDEDGGDSERWQYHDAMCEVLRG